MPPQQNVCCVLKLTSQERSTFQKHWAAINDSEPQKIMMGKCTQKFNQWDTQKPKLFIWGDRFFEKKS